MVDKYQDPTSGEYVGVPGEDGLLASALLGGVSKETPQVTVTDAFAAYLEENALKMSDPRGECFWARLTLETALKWIYRTDPALRRT